MTNNSTDKVILTKQGYKKLVDELNHLKNAERQKIARMLEEARSHGDIRENAEYDSAKDYQAQIESRILQIESLLDVAEVHEDKVGQDGRVALGCKVSALNHKNKKKHTFTIVGYGESDPFNGYITIHSPIGSALLGKRAGEKVEVDVPSGKVVYEILEIKPQ